MTLSSFDKTCALKRIAELDEKLFLSDGEQQEYQDRIEIVEAFDRQFRSTWKAERKAFFNSRLQKKLISSEEAERKISEIDADADEIIGKLPVYPWSK